MVWQAGQPWRTVRSVTLFHQQLRAAVPRSVPPATDPNSWGTIADDQHSTSSDHYPHYYPALGSVAVVCAGDAPQAPQLGLDQAVVFEALRASRDPRIGYVIYNRKITGPSHDWRADDYDGTNPHTDHLHLSTVHTQLADDTRPWSIGMEEDFVATIEQADWDALKWRVKALVDGSDDVTGGPTTGEDVVLARKVKALEAKVQELLDRPPAQVSAGELAAALVAEPAFATALAQAAFDGAQRAERE